MLEVPSHVVLDRGDTVHHGRLFTSLVPSVKISWAGLKDPVSYVGGSYIFVLGVAQGWKENEHLLSGPIALSWCLEFRHHLLNTEIDFRALLCSKRRSILLMWTHNDILLSPHRTTRGKDQQSNPLPKRKVPDKQPTYTPISMRSFTAFLETCQLQVLDPTRAS